jgi:FkbM family methyltransferase
VKKLIHLLRLVKTRILTPQPEEHVLIKNKLFTKNELSRLQSGEKTSSVLFDKPINITDSFWYLHSLNEIFVEEGYRFSSTKESPYILDCGANIGLSVIYFKRLFPKARIVAFEPDVQIGDLLKRNLQTFGYPDVVVENSAVWTEETVLNFTANGSLSGRIHEGELQEVAERVIRVPAVRLRNYLAEEIDFLKIDIEGPEVAVLKDCADLLTNVKNLFVEYHSDPSKEQELDQLLLILRNAGFRVYVKEAWNNLPMPFLHKNYQPYFDLQLNIFAYRVN